MGLRHRLGFYIGTLLPACAAVGPVALAQTPPQPLAQPPATMQMTTPGIAPAGAPAKATFKPGAGPERPPHTLAEALAQTYLTQPALQAERARLRATDENVPQALAGWRPTVVMAGTAGYGDGFSRQYVGGSLFGGSSYQNSQTDRVIATAQATLTQPLYTGGKTQANINRAKDAVMAERASLLQQEQTSFFDTVNAYVGVIETRQLLTLNRNNVQVLQRQLQATNDRFRVGEITMTDVAQAEAALAGAQAQLETSQGNLLTANGTFVRVIGFFPPEDLIEPQPLALPVKSQQDATQIAAHNNPQVVSAMFNYAAAKDAVDVAFSQLLPQASLQAQAFQSNNASSRSTQVNGYQVVAQLSVPIYQGGGEYSAVRQAKQTAQQQQRAVEDARRTAVQNAVQAWETLVSARAAAESTRSQIRANQVALQGVEREAIVGSRTTLDVLNAQQALLNSQVTLVQNLSQLVTASYNVASAIGRLTARDMRLPVPIYDETAYYQAVKDRWAGLGDFATNQPGR